MRPWLAAALLGCEGSDKPVPEPHPVPTGDTSDTELPDPIDSDGDGIPDSWDCAPDDPTVFPGGPELCNGLDDNCDGRSDADEDGDGSLWCDDCDETRSDVFPGAPEADGDGLDSNCDGTDGVGTMLPAPFRTGQTTRRTAGFALAGGDVDGDGCAELLIGEPGGWAGFPPEEDAASLGIGCWPWEDEMASITDEYPYMGYEVALAPGLVAALEGGWRGSRGRVLVFDETFGPTATPLLEVRGGSYDREMDSFALLGEPVQWLLIGRQASLDWSAAFYLVDASRRGIVDFEVDEPDLTLTTESSNFAVGARLGSVGDRDGDGQVDLGLIGEMGTRPMRFFPQVTSGHVEDAPEAWTDAASGEVQDQILRDGGDLDGDGRSEAVYASLFGDGQDVGTGRAFLVPWLGSGEFDLDEHAPTRIDGENTYDALGYDSEIADVDGDGQNDLVIGAPGAWTAVERPGKVLFFAGPLPPGVLTTDDAAVLWVGEQWGDHAGTAVAAGDFDGSGRMDVAIGAPFADRDGVEDAGTVHVLLDPL